MIVIEKLDFSHVASRPSHMTILYVDPQSKVDLTGADYNEFKRLISIDID